MPPDHRASPPVETVRDLIELARSAYQETRSNAPATPERLVALEYVGRELGAALQLAAKYPPGSRSHRAVRSHMARGIEELCRVMGTDMDQLLALTVLVK